MKYLFEFSVSFLESVDQDGVEHRVRIEHREFGGETFEEILEKLKLERLFMEGQ